MRHALHVTTWHPYVDGVSGAFVLEQCAALQASGFKVGLVFSRVEGLRSLRANRLLRGRPGFVRLDYPIPTVGFKSWNVPGLRSLAPRLNLRMIRRCYAAYKEEMGRPDVLHAHVALETGMATRRIAAEDGLDYVVTEHSSEVLLGLTPSRRALAQQVYGDARAVIAVSDILAERISEVCPGAKVRVVPNLVSDSVFKLRRHWTSADSAADRTIRIISIGGLVHHKRVHLVLAMLGNLPAGLRAKIRYDVVGDGPERGALQAAARKVGIPTVFHGNVPHERAMAILSGADLLVHASAFETFGVVIAEAMALGVPVVATQSGGPDSVVTPNAGMLVPVDDANALRDAVALILRDCAAWRMASDATSMSAYERFGEAHVASAIAESYL